MKKRNILVLMFALALGACTQESVIDESTLDNQIPEANLPVESIDGEILIKFAPEMTEILDQTFKSRAAGSRSGIPSTDEILETLGAYQFERVFPIDKRTEERSRKAGMHLWYVVKFDKNVDMNEAYSRLSRLGEISKVQCNLKMQLNNRKLNRSLVPEEVSSRPIVFGEDQMPFGDPMLKHQWGYINRGNYAFNQYNGEVLAGADVGCEDAWKKCTGDPHIIVAVMDEGVMVDHEDLADNMWVNEGERDHYLSDEDHDGNGYPGDKYGYNFSADSPLIAVQGTSDMSHGTHVAGTISAVNNNDKGVGGIAGGDYKNGQPGVRIMSIQIIDDNHGTTLLNEARGIKYAADNGAVILQCSWGYMSAWADPLDNPQLGPETDDEWIQKYPLEKEAFDYFLNNAGSPNGVIDGGVVVFASGNEYAAKPAYPAAYPKFVCVSAVAADFTPSVYTNYGAEVDLSAPGGDSEYYCRTNIGEDAGKLPQIEGGMILSTMVVDGVSRYGYMEGTSMACPHVSGVAALGLSYAYQLRKHYKAEEFIKLLTSNECTMDLNQYYVGKKPFYNRPTVSGAMLNSLELGNYRGKMGRMVRADLLLNAIEDGVGSTDIKVPNIYVAPSQTVTLDLGAIFKSGITFTCSIADTSVATLTMEGSKLTVTGVKTGFTKLNVKPSEGAEQTVIVTVRKQANNDGWL